MLVDIGGRGGVVDIGGLWLCGGRYSEVKASDWAYRRIEEEVLMTGKLITFNWDKIDTDETHHELGNI